MQSPDRNTASQPGPSENPRPPKVLSISLPKFIGFVAGEACEEVVPQADIVVALGHPGETAGIDIVICPDEIAATVSEDGTLSVGCPSEGKTLGLLALWLDMDGKLARHDATELALTRDVGESASIRQILTAFYRDMAAENLSRGSPRFAERWIPANGPMRIRNMGSS